jgi:hypothetical protein
MDIAQRVVIVVLGLALVAWTAHDVRRATTWTARVRAVLPLVLGVVAGALLA